MFQGREFGYAWIEIWTRVLGAGDPDTFLRAGVGVKGAVYNRWADRWKSEPRGVGVVEFLMSHLEAIGEEAHAAKRCPECGTEEGLHAPYCQFFAAQF